MQETKIVFSKEELDLLNNPTVWDYKRSLTTKLYEVLGNCTNKVKTEHEGGFRLLAGKDNLNAKISKGENYLGKPYVILDYPNLFKQDEILAVRTMFWFGETLSCSIIVSGAYINKLPKQFIANLARLKDRDIYFCLSDTPWHHHFEEDNMTYLSSVSEEQITNHITPNGFLKLARKTDTTDPGKWENFILESYKLYVSLIT